MSLKERSGGDWKVLREFLGQFDVPYEPGLREMFLEQHEYKDLLIEVLGKRNAQNIVLYTYLRDQIAPKIYGQVPEDIWSKLLVYVGLEGALADCPD